MIIGSDHSVWDWTTEDDGFRPIDWTRSQAVFTFLKACDGVWDTPYYAESIAMARAAGKLAAPYVWLYARNHTSPRAQAEFWYSRLKDEPLIVVDFESWRTYSYPDYDDLYVAIERLRQLGYAGKIIIYTGHWYWLAHGSTSVYWKQFPAWLARYSTTPPQPTSPWTKETFWQFSASGDPEIYGITNGKLAVDQNWFYGTPDELAELFGAAIPPEPPGEKMITIATVVSPTLNIRSTPDLDSTTNIIGPGFLKANDILYCVEETATCIRLTKAQRGATALVLPGQVCWASIGAAYVRQVWHIATDAALPVNVKVTANGTQVHNKDVPAGGAVAIAITD